MENAYDVLYLLWMIMILFNLSDECATNPCDAVGTLRCNDLTATFSCTCNTGYSGALCPDCKYIHVYKLQELGMDQYYICELGMDQYYICELGMDKNYICELGMGTCVVVNLGFVGSHRYILENGVVIQVVHNSSISYRVAKTHFLSSAFLYHG